MDKKNKLLPGMTIYISNKCGITTQTVRDVLKEKTKGKYHEQISDAYSLFMEENKVRTTSLMNMERIIVPQGMSKYLGEVFKRSHPFVRKALRGQTNHPDAFRIRELAKQKISELK